MPTKKGKRTTKRATVDKSTKQSVRQHVTVNVNTTGSGSKSKRKRQSQPANVTPFNKGMTYMAGTPYRGMMFPTIQHNTTHREPNQHVFNADFVNRLSALENVRNSQIVDEQQRRSVVVPLATQTRTALQPVNLPQTPELLRDSSGGTTHLPLPPAIAFTETKGETPTAQPMPTQPETPLMKTPDIDVPTETMQKLDEDRRSHVNDLQDIMRASTSYENDLFDDVPVPKFHRSPYELRSTMEAEARTPKITQEEMKAMQGKVTGKTPQKEQFLTKLTEYQQFSDADIRDMYKKAYPNKEIGDRDNKSLITALIRDAKKRSSRIPSPP